MDPLSDYRQIVRRAIAEYAPFKPSYGDVEVEMIFDDSRGHYELSWIGWDGWRRVHSCLIHIDILEDKVWIQHDGTENGIAEELVAAGIPRDHIVLAFHHPSKRKLTEYAVA